MVIGFCTTSLKGKIPSLFFHHLSKIIAQYENMISKNNFWNKIGLTCVLPVGFRQDLWSAKNISIWPRNGSACLTAPGPYPPNGTIVDFYDVLLGVKGVGNLLTTVLLPRGWWWLVGCGFNLNKVFTVSLLTCLNSFSLLNRGENIVFIALFC